MTCIAGIAQGGKVWIGGDSVGADMSTYSMTVRADEKVFRKGEFAYGFTSSFRMGDLLRYAFAPPEQTAKQGDREYLCTAWMDSLRVCMATGGFKQTENGVETVGTFLLGYRGTLYQVCDNLQVAVAASGYDACGCGRDIAKGSLFSTKGDPRRRIITALRAAEAGMVVVRGPFKVVSV